MKTLLTILLLLPLFGFGCNSRLGAAEADTVASLSAVMEDLQTKNMRDDGRYYQITKFTENGVTVWADEYWTPKGEKGTQFYMTKANGSMKSWGWGPEATSRSFDWTAVHVTST